MQNEGRAAGGGKTLGLVLDAVRAEDGLVGAQALLFHTLFVLPVALHDVAEALFGSIDVAVGVSSIRVRGLTGVEERDDVGLFGCLGLALSETSRTLFSALLPATGTATCELPHTPGLKQDPFQAKGPMRDWSRSRRH